VNVAHTFVVRARAKARAKARVRVRDTKEGRRKYADWTESLSRKPIEEK